TVRGKPVKVHVRTDYPFRDTVEIIVSVAEPMTFPLWLRRPDGVRNWSTSVQARDRMAGPPDETGASRSGYQVHDVDWNGSLVYTIKVRPDVQLVPGDRGALAVRRGPIVFALPIGSEFKKVVDRPNLAFDDWEVTPQGPWNHALALDRERPDRSLTFEE